MGGGLHVLRCTIVYGMYYVVYYAHIAVLYMWVYQCTWGIRKSFSLWLLLALESLLLLLPFFWSYHKRREKSQTNEAAGTAWPRAFSCHCFCLFLLFPLKICSSHAMSCLLSLSLPVSKPFFFPFCTIAFIYIYVRTVGPTVTVAAGDFRTLARPKHGLVWRSITKEEDN